MWQEESTLQIYQIFVIIIIFSQKLETFTSEYFYCTKLKQKNSLRSEKASQESALRYNLMKTSLTICIQLETWEYKQIHLKHSQDLCGFVNILLRDHALKKPWYSTLFLLEYQQSLRKTKIIVLGLDDGNDELDETVYNIFK